MAQSAVLIGLGMVSDIYAAAFADLKGRVDLRGVYARSADQRQAFARRHGTGVLAYADLDMILADEAVDFAVLATPPDARAEYVEAFANAGIPILMEKPIERTLDAATALVARCEAAGLPLGIMLQHRARPSALAKRRRIESGELGAIHAVEISVPWWRPQSYYDQPGRGTRARDGGGVMINQAIHTMDLALSLLPPLRSVVAMASTTGFHRMETEDFVTAGLRFEGGIPGTLFATTAAFPGRAETIRLHFQNAAVALQSNAMTIQWQDGREEVEGTAATTGAGADPMAFTHHWHRDVIADFAEALDNRRPPLVPGRTALAVHRMIDAIERAAASGTRVELPQ